MANTTSGAGYLPTIKCSMCAQDIAISKMGEHVCNATGLGAATPPPESTGQFDQIPYKKNNANGPAFLKPGRAMPPRVDTSAANRPFIPQGQLTPLSSSSPADGHRSPFQRPLRSATAPLFRRPPSPEPLSSNLDCAFPPFPTKASTNRPKTPASRSPDPNLMYAPVSPRTADSGGLLKRMNTIAPGPFDMNSRKVAANPPAAPPIRPGHQRQASVGSLKEMVTPSSAAEMGASIVRPATAGAGHSRKSTNSSNESKSEIAVPKVPKNTGYGGFGPPAGQDVRRALRPEDRSNTFPLQSSGQNAPSRSPSEPRSALDARRPSNEPSARPHLDDESRRAPSAQRKKSFSGPDRSRPLPPRGASLIRPRQDARLGDAPPVPSSINLAAEFGVGNPYHTPTESQSSNTSASSEESKASSRSSPPRSAESAARAPADDARLDSLMSEITTSMANLQSNQPPSAQSPPKNTSPLKTKPQNPMPLAPPVALRGEIITPESPIVGAFPSGRSSPPKMDMPPPPLQRPPMRSKTPDGRRPTTAKGNCKGCGEAIKGKSVSSADGRLTGRYHKHCFVCATCHEPFQASTFYVINDAPYCERHYHKLNGSVCSTCDKGIEGQYLESESKQKFHPTCLICADCKRVLRHDYFEMNGRVYCERDAFRRAQQGRSLIPGGLGLNARMERRTTRLMM